MQLDLWKKHTAQRQISPFHVPLPLLMKSKSLLLVAKPGPLQGKLRGSWECEGQPQCYSLSGVRLLLGTD